MVDVGSRVRLVAQRRSSIQGSSTDGGKKAINRPTMMVQKSGLVAQHRAVSFKGELRRFSS
jgi:hypothetical protein